MWCLRAQAETAQTAPGSGRPLPRAASNTSTIGGVSGVEQGSPAAKKRGSIEHEGSSIFFTGSSQKHGFTIPLLLSFQQGNLVKRRCSIPSESSGRVKMSQH